MKSYLCQMWWMVDNAGMTLFLALKLLHIGCVLFSFCGFLLRAFLLLFHPKMMGRAWVKYPPHIVESLLILSALAMLPLLGQYPFVDEWLTAKLLAMLLYIAIGAYALHGEKGMAVRVMAMISALTVFAYIVGVAVYQSSFSWLT